MEIAAGKQKVRVNATDWNRVHRGGKHAGSDGFMRQLATIEGEDVGQLVEGIVKARA